MAVNLKPREQCQWDAAALGEIMLRLDPGDGRIRTTRSFQVWEGGGEYNVVRGLRRCFGLRSTVVTAIVDNEIGRLLEDLMLQGGVDLSHVKWVPFDGIGRAARVGLNFTEKGFGVRAAVGCSDRGWSAASQLKPGDVDWKRLFEVEGVRWFHCGGIFAALSATTSAIVIEAMEAARAAGTVISYDLNFRPSLWKSQGGTARAVEVNRKIASLVDVMIGNEEDFTAALGFQVPGLDEHISKLDPANFKKMIAEVVKCTPTSRPSPRPCATPRRPPSTTGARSCGPAANSTKPRCARTWRSTTASAAATASLPAWPTVSWPARRRSRRWSTARRTAPWP